MTADDSSEEPAVNTKQVATATKVKTEAEYRTVFANIQVSTDELELTRKTVAKVERGSDQEEANEDSGEEAAEPVDKDSSNTAGSNKKKNKKNWKPKKTPWSLKAAVKERRKQRQGKRQKKAAGGRY
jgi:hypothetical protein